MKIETAMVRIDGVSPLLIHSSGLANPMNPWAQKISKIAPKRANQRTEQDLLDLIEYEFQGGLYFDDEIGAHIPSVNLEGLIRDGAKAQKGGKKVTAGLQVDPDMVPLIYDGPRTREGLFQDKRFVDVRPVKLNGKSTVMRARPRFDQWSLEFMVQVFTDVLSLTLVHEALDTAGRLKGLGDFRPKFGRFVVKEFEVG